MILAPALAALLAASAAAEGGSPVTFAGEGAALAVEAGPSIPGVVLWESGESDPLPGPAQALLLQGRVPEGVSFEASVGSGPWHAAAIYRADSGRFWGRLPAAAPKGTVVSLRVVSLGTAGGPLELFGVETLAPAKPVRGKPKPPAAPSPSPETPAAKPTVRPREDWGAKPTNEPYEDMVPEKISVHHSQADQPLSLKSAAEELRMIQDFHQRGRGWADVAYHFLIDGSGRVWQGRPEGVLGAHVKDNNPGNIGVCVMGSFQKGRPTKAQMDSLVALLRWLTQAYAIAPSEIRGHKDQQSTRCPGARLYSQLPAVRQAVLAPEKLASRAAERLKVYSLSADGTVLSSLRSAAIDGRR